MSSLNEIEEFLNIEIGDKKLRHGKKKMNKNTYYWFKNEWFALQKEEKQRELIQVKRYNSIKLKTKL